MRILGSRKVQWTRPLVRKKRYLLGNRQLYILVPHMKLKMSGLKRAQPVRIEFTRADDISKSYTRLCLRDRICSSPPPFFKSLVIPTDSKLYTCPRINIIQSKIAPMALLTAILQCQSYPCATTSPGFHCLVSRVRLFPALAAPARPPPHSVAWHLLPAAAFRYWQRRASRSLLLQ